MTIDKRVLIPIYEMLEKQIKGYIKCFDVNVSDLGYHRPSRPSTGRAKVTVATSRFLLTSTG